MMYKGKQEKNQKIEDFYSIYNQYSPAIFRFIYRLIKDTDEAQDHKRDDEYRHGDNRNIAFN